MNRDLSQLSMHDLFRIEAENQTQVLIGGLLALERDTASAQDLAACMRAAHSLKGAARIVDLASVVDLTHSMEDCFVAAQKSQIHLGRHLIDVLLRGVDLLLAISKEPETADLGGDRKGGVAAFLATLRHAQNENSEPKATEDPEAVHESAERIAAAEVDATYSNALVPEHTEPVQPDAPAGDARPPVDRRVSSERSLRVTAERLNRLLALAGESLMASRQLKPLVEPLLKLKRLHDEASRAIDSLREEMLRQTADPSLQAAVAEAQRLMLECRQLTSREHVDMENFDRQFSALAQRLYDEAMVCRMRPFSDGIQRLPRVVRDLSRTLHKSARLEIVGAGTQVDRDILEKLDAPLSHLLHNAVDHGIESPEERLAAGKPPEGVIQLEARHSAGMLQITVSDDGRGIDMERMRNAVLARGLSTAETVGKLSSNELLEFLFLPGFTMTSVVTEISGRGVGLDVVQNMIKQVRGVAYVTSQQGKGMRFQLQLPLTLSVIRTLLVEIGGEPYAFPLAHIVSTVRLPRESIEVLEGQQHFSFHGRRIGLATAHQIVGGRNTTYEGGELSVVVVGDQQNMYGLVVDRFLGQQELVVQPLDVRLGKIKDISASALMENGSPVLILDVEDMIRSVEKLVASGPLNKVQSDAQDAVLDRRKKVLVVDDSLTVRELERKLLDQHGYEVEVAVDGMDGWNVVRTGDFDLVITDIDMPRMDGIELVTNIRHHANLKSTPVMIVSYKDREEDRRRGLEAGADYYLTKGSFHDETLVQAVIDLIGEAGE